MCGLYLISAGLPSFPLRRDFHFTLLASRAADVGCLFFHFNFFFINLDGYDFFLPLCLYARVPYRFYSPALFQRTKGGSRDVLDMEELLLREWAMLIFMWWEKRSLEEGNLVR